jgi:CubicO group peptidase (beta-lactamase class C family)
MLCIEFFTDFARYSPAFASGETPAYSNVAFQLIAYAFEEITGKTFATALQESVLTPLGLTKTSYTAPAASLGVIPGTLEKTEWSFEMGEESPYVLYPPISPYFCV